RNERVFDLPVLWTTALAAVFRHRNEKLFGDHRQFTTDHEDGHSGRDSSDGHHALEPCQSLHRVGNSAGDPRRFFSAARIRTVHPFIYADAFAVRPGSRLDRGGPSGISTGHESSITDSDVCLVVAHSDDVRHGTASRKHSAF